MKHTGIICFFLICLCTYGYTRQTLLSQTKFTNNKAQTTNGAISLVNQHNDGQTTQFNNTSNNSEFKILTAPDSVKVLRKRINIVRDSIRGLETQLSELPKESILQQEIIDSLIELQIKNRLFKNYNKFMISEILKLSEQLSVSSKEKYQKQLELLATYTDNVMSVKGILIEANQDSYRRNPIRDNEYREKYTKKLNSVRALCQKGDIKQKHLCNKIDLCLEMLKKHSARSNKVDFQNIINTL